MRCRMSSLISEALIAISSSSVLSDELFGEPLQTRAHRAVDYHVVRLNDGPADQRRVDRKRELHRALELLLERALDLLRECAVDGSRRRHRDVDLVLGLGLQ